MYFNRKAWGARPPTARYRLNPDQVQGIALHWPAAPAKHSVEDVMALLRAIQRAHMDTDQIAEGGASDIAYQAAVDMAGNLYQLRGLRHRSGANGDMDVNQRFGALLLVIAAGEKPSPAMVTTVRSRIARFRHIYPGARRIVGHQDIRPAPTACPGPIVQEGIESGLFVPRRSSGFVTGRIELVDDGAGQ